MKDISCVVISTVCHCGFIPVIRLYWCHVYYYFYQLYCWKALHIPFFYPLTALTLICETENCTQKVVSAARCVWSFHSAQSITNCNCNENMSWVWFGDWKASRGLHKDLNWDHWIYCPDCKPVHHQTSPLLNFFINQRTLSLSVSPLCFCPVSRGCGRQCKDHCLSHQTLHKCFKSFTLWHQICAPPPLLSSSGLHHPQLSPPLSGWGNMYRPICSTTAYGSAGGRYSEYSRFIIITPSLIWSWSPRVGED